MTLTLPHSAPGQRTGAPDHRHAPVLEAIQAYQRLGTMPFSAPGHKLGSGAGDELRVLLGRELFAADVWLNTADHDRAVCAAQALAAAAWGADRTFFLVNGSSSGNHAFLLATLGPGDEVVVARDVHTSVLTALILTGARPVWVAPRLHPGLDISLGPDPAEVAAALAAHPAAKLVVLTSPTYWGVAADVAAIADVAHARGVPLYVDEAWGPHLPFHPDLPPAAISSGADGAVTSPHKLLGGLSQAAMVHTAGPRIDTARLASVVKMTQSTSPLLPILASLDACRRQMAIHGEALLERTLALAEGARLRLQHVPGIAVLDAAQLGLPARRYDATRLVIDVQALGITGFQAEHTLRHVFGIAPEMSDSLGIICVVSIGDTPASIGRLIDAVTALAAAGPAAGTPRRNRSVGQIVTPGPQALSPREAYFAPGRSVPLAEAVGEVAGELVVPYPPGIPVFVPGEVVSADKGEYLAEIIALGGHVRGPADPELATLRVVADGRDRLTEPGVEEPVSLSWLPGLW